MTTTLRLLKSTLLCLSLFTTSQAATTDPPVRVNGSYEAITGSVTSGYLLTPDGSHAIFKADAEEAGLHELYSVPTSGGLPVKLNPPLSGDDFIARFELTPDGQTVVFLVYHSLVATLFSLPSTYFAVPVTGGTPVKLTPDDGYFPDFKVTPDSSHFIAWGYSEDGQPVIYRNHLDGGNLVEITEDLDAKFTSGGSQFDEFVVSDDSSTLAFSTTDGNVHVQAIAGGEITSIEADTTSISLSRDGGTLFWVEGRAVLRSLTLATGEVTLLTDPDTPGHLRHLKFSPDNDRLAFTIAPFASPEDRHVYLADLSEGTSVLIKTIVPFGHIQPAIHFTPDLGHVIYTVDRNLYCLSTITGSLPIRLNLDPSTDGDVGNAILVEGGNRVVYTSHRVRDVSSLYSTHIDGSDEIRLGANSREIRDFKVAADGVTILYGRRLSSEGFSLAFFATTTKGGIPVQVTPTLTYSYASARQAVISSDGEHFIYLDDHGNKERTELYLGRTNSLSTTKLSDELARSGRVASWKLSPDQATVVYHSDRFSQNHYELFAKPIAGGDDVFLTGANPNWKQISRYAISADGKRVVFQAEEEDGPVKLFSVPLTGGETTRLSSPGVGVGFFEFDSLNDAVIFEGTDDTDHTRLYSVSREGGESTAISGSEVTPVLGTLIGVSPDGLSVIFQARPPGQTGSQLYTLPTGGGEATLLSAGMDLDESGFEPIISNDGSFVFFAATRPGQSVPNVHRVSLANGEVVTLTNLLPEETLVAYKITSHNDTILYSVTQPSPNDELPVTNLYLADLSAEAPVRVNQNLTNGGSVSSFEMTPDGSTVIFVQRLSSVRGSFPQLLAFSTTGGEIRNLARSLNLDFNDEIFEISPDGDLFIFAGRERVGELIVSFPKLYFVSLPSGMPSEIIDSKVPFEIIFQTSPRDLDENPLFLADSSRILFNAEGPNGWKTTLYLWDLPETSADIDLSGSGHQVELCGTIADSQYPKLRAEGSLTLGGILNVTIAGTFNPQAGDIFDLWDAGSIEGSFSEINLPELADGLFWHPSGLESSGELRIGTTPETYAEFATFNGLGDPLADDDGNGFSNLFDFVLPGFEGLVPNRDNGFSHVKFPLARPPGRGVEIELQVAESLTNGENDWRTVAKYRDENGWSGSTAVQQFWTNDGGQMMIANLDYPAPVGFHQKRFYRIKVSLTE